MRVTVSGTTSTEIEDSVVERALNLYPEEKLAERPVFQRAFANGVIELQELREESDKILIAMANLPFKLSQSYYCN